MQTKSPDSHPEIASELLALAAGWVGDVLFRMERECRYTYIAGRALRDHGLSPEFFLGRTVQEVFGADFARPHDEAIRRALNGEQVTYHWGLEALLGHRVMECTAGPHRDSDGEIIGVIGVSRDVTSSRIQEKAQQEAERRMIEMLRNFDLMAVTLDRTGMISFCNQHLLMMTGWNQDEVLGKDWFDTFLVPEVRETMRNCFSNWLRNGQAAGHRAYEILTRNDDRLLIQWNQTLLLDEHGEPSGLTCVGENVTDEVNHRHQREHDDAAYQGLVETVSGVVYRRLAVPPYTLTYVGPACRDLLGMEPHELKGPADRLIGLVHPDHLERVARAMEEGALAGRHQVEYPLIRPDGRQIWVRDQAVVLAAGGDLPDIVQGIFTDITADREAKEIGRKYQILSQLSTDVVLFVDRRDGRILEANRAAEMTYGYERSRLIGLPLAALRPPEERSSIAAQMKAAQDGVLRAQITHMRADGTCFPVDVSAQSFNLGDDQVLVGLIRDATARVRQERIRGLLHAMHLRLLEQVSPERLLTFACADMGEIFGCRQIDLELLSPAGPVNLPIRTGWSQEGATPDPSSQPDPVTVPIHVSGAEVGHLRVTPGAAGLDLTARADLGALADQIGMVMTHAHHQAQIHLQSEALSAAANAVAITDVTGLIRWVNPAFTELTGYTFAEAIGRNPSLLKSGKHPPEFYRHMWETIRSGQVWRGTLENRRKDGRIYTEEMTITPVANADGDLTHFIAIKEDVTQRKAQEARIAQLASEDFVTGLANRRSLAARLEETVAEARQGRRATLIVMDLDNFKLVNDAVGHQAGDKLLQDLARLMAQAVRPGDTLARLGGDEFAVICRGAGLAEGREIGERLRQIIDGYRFTWGESVFVLSASAGLTAIDGSMTADEALAAADAALYAAKEAGRNRLAVGGTEREAEEVRSTARWLTRIKDAIQEERLVITYQPLVNLADGTRQNREALVRMRSNQGELLPPSEFIPVAERFGMMGAVDRLVIRQAFRDQAARGTGCVFINISGLTLTEEGLADYLRSEADAAGLDLRAVCLEVTETVSLSDLTLAERRMRELVALGCRFALDDFGAGFASFAYLRLLPVNFVKLDGSLTRHLQQSEENRTVVRAVIEIAHALGKQVVAEHVEEAADAHLLREMGVEFGQGFLWARPELLPAEPLEQEPAAED